MNETEYNAALVELDAEYRRAYGAAWTVYTLDRAEMGHDSAAATRDYLLQRAKDRFHAALVELSR